MDKQEMTKILGHCLSYVIDFDSKDIMTSCNNLMKAQNATTTLDSKAIAQKMLIDYNISII